MSEFMNWVNDQSDAALAAYGFAAVFFTVFTLLCVIDAF